MNKITAVSTSILVVVFAVTITYFVLFPVGGIGQKTSSQVTPALEVGQPKTFAESFYYSGTGVNFVPYEVIPITVVATTTTTLSLAASSIPAGVWVHFSAGTVDANPQGTTVDLTLMGAVEPMTPVPGGENISMEISASSASMDLNATIPLAVGGFPIIQLQNQSSDLLPSNVEIPSNASEPFVVGLVYSPAESSNQPSVLHGTMNVLGQYSGGTISPLPNWLNLGFSNQSLTLDEYQPAYFALDEQNSANLTAQSSSLTLSVAISESLNNYTHTQVIGLTLTPPVVA